MRLARWIFGTAAVYGVLALLPLYFLEDTIARVAPPALTHVEFYYGFIGIALAWQLLFALIACDPLRWRPAMLCAVAEKLGFALPVVLLHAAGRAGADTLALALIDLLLGAAFVAAYRQTRPEQQR